MLVIIAIVLAGQHSHAATPSTRLALTLQHLSGAVVVSIVNLGNSAPVVNSRLSSGGPWPELTFSIRRGTRSYPAVASGMPAPLGKEHYIQLLPAKATGVIYFDRFLKLTHQLPAGCYDVRASYQERAHLVKSFRGRLNSNTIKVCL
jgi:hypothetical protein